MAQALCPPHGQRFTPLTNLRDFAPALPRGRRAPPSSARAALSAARLGAANDEIGDARSSVARSRQRHRHTGSRDRGSIRCSPDGDDSRSTAERTLAAHEDAASLRPGDGPGPPGHSRGWFQQAVHDASSSIVGSTTQRGRSSQANGSSSRGSLGASAGGDSTGSSTLDSGSSGSGGSGSTSMATGTPDSSWTEAANTLKRAWQRASSPGGPLAWQQPQNTTSQEQQQAGHEQGASAGAERAAAAESCSGVAGITRQAQQQDAQPEQGTAQGGEREQQQEEQQPRGPRPVFDIPWGWGQVCVVMTIWLVAFWINCWVLEFGLELWTGCTSSQLSPRGRALYHVVLDTNNLALTAVILLVKLRAWKPLTLDCFRPRLRPLAHWWPVLISCVLFPALNWFAVESQVWFPVDSDAWDVEDVLAAGDMVTNAMYFVLLTILAPIWEELIFRGFLLASLTKYMPPPAAVLASSLVFAFAHFSWQRSVALVLLGCILGGLFVLRRNLLHSVLLHSLWNFCIFYQLVSGVPAAAGV